MRAINMNHVSVSAYDIENSIRFYEGVFGAQRIPTPRFAVPVQWLRLGSGQLHLFEDAQPAPARAHHFAVTVTVDDFDAIFATAKSLRVLDGVVFGHHLYELPGGEGQMYLRDPGGNLVEVNCAGVAAAGPQVLAEIRKLSDDRPQSEENQRARLFLAGSF